MMSMRWCGARARVAASGLAVPMSMSRYTSAESTLMSSTGRRCASSTATPVLPLAVGPMRKMARGRIFIKPNLTTKSTKGTKQHTEINFVIFGCFVVKGVSDSRQLPVARFAHQEHRQQTDRRRSGDIIADPGEAAVQHQLLREVGCERGA